MKKTFPFFSIIMSCLTIISCASTSNYVISKTEVKYDTCYIADPLSYTGNAYLGSIDVEMFSMLKSSRVKVIGEGEVDQLTQIQKKKLLVVKYGVESSFFDSVVTISFFDYLTKRPVINCTGTSMWGLPSVDVPSAKKRAFQQLEKALKEL